MSPTKKTRNYRNIVSSTALFGSAQVLNVVMNAVKVKLVAWILHSTGMGIMSLLTNAANTIQQISLMGINISAVRHISQVCEAGDERVLATTVRIVRSMVFIAAILGFLLTLAFSPLMTQLSFDSLDYLPFFLLLSVVVFINIMGTGELAIMQGLRRYKQLAFCSVVPSLGGLLISVPIYYVWGLKGIVPAMIVMALVYYLAIRFYSFRDRTPRSDRPRVTLQTIWTQGHEIIQFGMVMTIGVVLGAVTTYALTAFISSTGSVADVGFYQAGNAITTQYIGMLFTAMATDYYPKLSSIVKERMSEARRYVNQQTEIVLLIVTPLSMLMILSAPLLINIFLTEEFQTILTMVRFMGLACIFKALCFPMDYIAYAKGDRNYIFWVEAIWGNVKTFTVISTFYLFMGIDGLGYGVLCSSVIDVLVCLLLTRLRYGFHLSTESLQLLIVMLSLAIVCFIASFIPHFWSSYLAMGALTLGCFIYSLMQLDRRMDMRALLRRFTHREESLEESLEESK